MIIALRFLLGAIALTTCSWAAPKKVQHVVFVATSGQGSAQMLGNVAKELKNRDSGIQVTMFTYSAYSASLFRYLQENETVNFFDRMIPLDINDRIRVNSVTANSSLGHFPALLGAFRANYDNELASLRRFNETYTPDLFVIDMYAVSAMDLSYDLKVPYIILYHDSTFNTFGPDPIEGVGKSFVDRLQQVADLPTQWETVSQLSDKHNANRHFHFASTYQSLSSLYSDRMLLIPSVFGLEVPQPLSPLVRMVGLYANKDPLAKKPSNGHEKVLLSWLNAGNKTSVLFCHFAEESSPSESQLRAVVEGGLSAGYRVLVSVRHEALSLLGIEYNGLIKGREDAVTMVPHAPLGLVLSLPKVVKVFLYQGSDLMAVSEAVYAGVPFLLLPATTNQLALADKILAAKLGLKLDHRNISVEAVTAAVTDLQVDKTRRRMVKRMKWLAGVNDQTGAFVNSSASVIQEVLSSGGYGHLVGPTARSEELLVRQLTQYGVDVFLCGVVVVFVAVHLLVLSAAVCCCRELARGRNKSKQE